MIKIIPRKEWTTGRTGSNGTYGKVTAVTCHWPADGVKTHSSSISHVKKVLQGYRRFHVNSRGWIDIGYNFAIDPAGRVWELRGMRNVGAHAASKANPRANTTRVGVLFIVGSDQQVTDKMWDAFLGLRAAILKVHPSATKIEGHQQVPGAATSCPGPAVMARVRGGAVSKPTEPTPTPSKPKPSAPAGGKSIAQMAAEVIAGQHGNGHTNRMRSLGVSDSVYQQVRAEVNKRAGVSTPKPAAKPKPKGKSVAAMADEVIAGKHGNGHAARRKSLGVSASVYAQVRAEVNRRAGVGTPAKAGKSVSTMAKEVIDGKHGNGHANRRKSLGVSNSVYQKVRAEVNRRS